MLSSGLSALRPPLLPLPPPLDARTIMVGMARFPRVARLVVSAVTATVRPPAVVRVARTVRRVAVVVWRDAVLVLRRQAVIETVGARPPPDRVVS